MKLTKEELELYKKLSNKIIEIFKEDVIKNNNMDFKRLVDKNLIEDFRVDLYDDKLTVEFEHYDGYDSYCRILQEKDLLEDFS